MEQINSMIEKISIQQEITNEIGNYNKYKHNIDKLINDLFVEQIDIYKIYSHQIELGQSNVYCRKYFDDEDFVYAKINISGDIIIDVNIINYITKYNIIINFYIDTFDFRYIYAKILYLFQYVNNYYSMRQTMLPISIVKNMPCTLLIWIENVINNIKYMIDNNIISHNVTLSSSNITDLNTFGSSTCTDTDNVKACYECDCEYSCGNTVDGDLDLCNECGNELRHKCSELKFCNINDTKIYYDELLYGLKLTLCHLKLLINYYKNLDINIYNMSEYHIKKMFRILNNMCILIIHFHN